MSMSTFSKLVKLLYDPSSSRILRFNFWRFFDVWPNCSDARLQKCLEKSDSDGVAAAGSNANVGSVSMVDGCVCYAALRQHAYFKGSK